MGFLDEKFIVDFERTETVMSSVWG